MGSVKHAVLKLNKQDSGNRKFILIQCDEYDKKGNVLNICENITATRVKRVISGYGEGENQIESLGGGFDFLEIGDSIFKEDKNLNEEVGEAKIREYIYYTETKQHLEREQQEEHKYLLDTFNETGYYFYYEKDQLTTLSMNTLSIVTEKGYCSKKCV